MTKKISPAPDKKASEAAKEKKQPSSADPKLPKKAIPDKPKKGNWAARMLLFVVIFFGGAVATVYFLPTLKARIPIVANWIGENGRAEVDALNQRINQQQLSINELTQKTIEMETRIGQIASGDDGITLEPLEERIAQLEAQTSTPPAEENDENISPPQDNSQSARIDMLLSRMSQLEASFIPLSKNMIDGAQAEKERAALSGEFASLSAKISDLEGRLVNVEKIASKDGSGILLNLKVAELKRTVISGQPYQSQLNNVSQLNSSSALVNNDSVNAAISSLSQNAAIGLVTPDQLRLRFNNLIPALLREEGITADAGWWQNTLTQMKNMITVRRTDERSLAQDDVDGLIAQIELWLSNGDLRPITELYETMPPALQSILENWNADIERWLQGEAAINRLERLAAESYLNVEAQQPVSDQEAPL